MKEKKEEVRHCRCKHFYLNIGGKMDKNTKSELIEILEFAKENAEYLYNRNYEIYHGYPTRSYNYELYKTEIERIDKFLSILKDIK